MTTRRLTGIGSLGRRAPALVAAALAAVALVAAAPGRAGAAGAAARPGGGVAPRGGPGALVISTVAGGVGGPARATEVAVYPCGVSFAAGNLYIAGGFAVRKVNPGTDWLTTPAGTGSQGPVGEGGSARKANLNTCAVAMDRSGNLVIADSFNHRLQVVAESTGTFYGQTMTAGDIYTMAGNGTIGFSGDGGPAASAELDGPGGVAVDAAGNLLIADTGNDRVRVVAARTGTFYGQPMTAGDIYTMAGNGTIGFSGDGGPATSAELSDPGGVAVDATGNLLIADSNNSRVRVVAARTGTIYGQAMTAGDIYTVAGSRIHGFSGDGGPATKASLWLPAGVAVDVAGNLVIADTFNERVRMVTG